MTSSLTAKGFNYTSYYNGAYENADSLAALAATGANSVALNIENGIDVDTSHVYSDQSYTDSLAVLGSTIREAAGLGLAVMVRPLIDFLDPAKIGPNAVGDWRSYFNPSDPAAFFASYKSMIVDEAQVAQANGATSLCIGVELDQLTGPQYLPYWTGIIAAVRAVFSGSLTYSADWNDAASPWQGHNGLGAGTGNLATQVSFWSQLDSLGIDAYPALSDAANPTLADLVAGWTGVPSDEETRSVTGDQSLIRYFDGVAAAVGKPLLLTELGYENASDAAREAAGSSTNVDDPTLQANLYQAFFKAWSQQDDGSLKGVYFWNWDPDRSEVGPGNGVNFSPQGQPAEDVVKAGFAADPTPGTAPTVTILPGIQTAAGGRATLAGTAAGPAGVNSLEILDGDQDLGAATLDGAGNWTLATTLGTGTHDFSAVATDGAGFVWPSALSTVSLQTGIQGAPYTSYEADLDASGNLVGEVFSKRNGTVYVSDTVTDRPNGDHVIDASAGSYFGRQDFDERVDLFDPDYDLKVETLYNTDGSHTVSASVDGQVLRALGDDVMTGGGSRETFLFRPRTGQALITDFKVQGAGHDILDLPSSRFSGIADVLGRTSTVDGSAEIRLGPNDVVTIANVTKAELRTHRQDFAFHA